MPERNRQPWLHGLEVAVHGNVTSISNSTGDCDANTTGLEATGLFVDDRRVLDLLRLRIDDVSPVGIASSSSGGRTECLLVARNLGDPGPDPTVEVRRVRTLTGSGLREEITVTSRASAPVHGAVVLTAHGDGSELHDVKSGQAAAAAATLTVESTAPGCAQWSDARHTTTVQAPGADLTVVGGAATATWVLEIAPGGSTTVQVDVSSERASSTPFDATAGSHLVQWDDIRVRAQDARVAATVTHSMRDLQHLLLEDPDQPGDAFAAAGSPWYLTLFGRDSIWAARMVLPFGTDLARGTLHALARRQGAEHDVATAQEPGKILHEVRRTSFVDPGHLQLPPTYYGTVDATPLWVCLLHDAWRWGMDPAEVQALRPNLLAALEWMRVSADAGGGVLRYFDGAGTGLSNQGWKDSGDAMRHFDGSIAEGPIALVETQAYAVEAALGAADLLEHVLGEDGAPWRHWATALAEQIRERFWVAGERGRYLAMALDGRDQMVDGVGSNMGHVLRSGALTPVESDRVARTLAAPDMTGPLGIRTLSSENPAYNPLGYHTGSVWTHDSAICAEGLARTGHSVEAAAVITALVDVAAASGYRWPELFGADPVGSAPAPYPASCRPQAWAAASAGSLVSTVLGLDVDAPRGTIHLSPLSGGPFGAMRVEGLRIGGRPFAVEIDAAGEVVRVEAPAGVAVTVGSRWR
jgi:glycogen debranching enzyme